LCDDEGVARQRCGSGVAAAPAETPGECACTKVVRRFWCTRLLRACMVPPPFAQMYRQYGGKALMRGGTITLIRDSFYGFYFAIYEVRASVSAAGESNGDRRVLFR
jgi:hypothetical protein